MNLPGFSAEASCYEAREQYRLLSRGYQAGATIHPQFVSCDPDCLNNCNSDCRQEPGGMRATCFRDCRRQCCHTTPFIPRL